MVGPCQEGASLEVAYPACQENRLEGNQVEACLVVAYQVASQVVVPSYQGVDPYQAASFQEEACQVDPFQVACLVAYQVGPCQVGPCQVVAYQGVHLVVGLAQDHPDQEDEAGGQLAPLGVAPSCLELDHPHLSLDPLDPLVPDQELKLASHALLVRLAQVQPALCLSRPGCDLLGGGLQS